MERTHKPWFGIMAASTVEGDAGHVLPVTLGPQAVVGFAGVVPRTPCGQREVEGCPSSERHRGAPQGDIFMTKPV